MSHLALSTISPLFVDRFGHSLRFCYLIFYKEAILIVEGVKLAGIVEGFLILSVFRKFLAELLWTLFKC